MLWRKAACEVSLLRAFYAHRPKHLPFALYTMSHHPPELQLLCNLVLNTIGSLDDLESSLNKCGILLRSSLVMQVIDLCKDESLTRRLLRFFTWSCKNLNSGLEDKDLNHAIRVFAEKKDYRAIHILLSDFRNQERVLEAETFCVVADILVKLGREDDALGIFKNLHLFKCPQDKVTVTAIITALCAKGHARRAEGVVWHQKDKISGAESCIYKALLYGWSVQENVKEARRILQEMKSKKILHDLYCYNTFLRCLCESKLKHNPSGLVPEALNVMVEMRSYKIVPNSVSYNILLSCLVRARRVKESIKILDSMKRSGCAPDWVSYYLVARVLYLTGRFGKGNQIVDQIMEEGLLLPPKFYHDLIGVLCGVERVHYALELFERMKRSSVGGYGPVYDILIPKLCSGGDFATGKELWDEAVKMGVTLSCSSNVLDPTLHKVFVPNRKEEEVRLTDSKAEIRKSSPTKIGKNKKIASKKQNRKITGNA
ncbi:hypothetical protein Ancab_038841 [Ancistrocladus abbreviatus]